MGRKFLGVVTIAVGLFFGGTSFRVFWMQMHDYKKTFTMVGIGLIFVGYGIRWLRGEKIK